ncbi:MAG TPA: hypothetical protein VGB54_04700 [Allosphingosinicella sp.]
MNQLVCGWLIGAAALVAAWPAQACSVVIGAGYEGSAQQVRDVRRAIDEASVVLDGEVVRPFVRGQHNALVRVERVLRGTAAATIEVGESDSCSIALEQAGERMRMILSAGPEVYLLYRDQSAARIEDRILRSDRRREWPYWPGQAQPAK